jgi:hypothetical protein
VAVRIGLDGLLRIYASTGSAHRQAETLVASHTLKDRQEGWSTQAEHRSDMWKNTISTSSMQRLPQVEQRALAVYEEVL